MAGTGKFTALGTAIAPGGGTAAGAVLDVGSLIAEGVGDYQAGREESERYGTETTMQKRKIAFAQELERRKQRRRDAISAALSQLYGGGA